MQTMSALAYLAWISKRCIFSDVLKICSVYGCNNWFCWMCWMNFLYCPVPFSIGLPASRYHLHVTWLDGYHRFIFMRVFNWEAMSHHVMTHCRSELEDLSCPKAGSKGVLQSHFQKMCTIRLTYRSSWSGLLSSGDQISGIQILWRRLCSFM